MEIQSLSVSERITLAEALWDSVAANDEQIAITHSQKTELISRLESLDSDLELGSSWETVKNNILNSR